MYFRKKKPPSCLSINWQVINLSAIVQHSAVCKSIEQWRFEGGITNRVDAVHFTVLRTYKYNLFWYKNLSKQKTLMYFIMIWFLYSFFQRENNNKYFSNVHHQQRLKSFKWILFGYVACLTIPKRRKVNR